MADIGRRVLSLDGNDWQLLHLVPREWESRQVWKQDFDVAGASPSMHGWNTGSVPGDVIADALDAGLIPHPFEDMNSRACEWLSQRDWVYRKDFNGPVLGGEDVLRLCFDGVDFEAKVYLNGELLGEHQGMFTPFEFDVTSKVRPGERNRLVVVVLHAPPVEAVQGQIGRTTEARLWKSRFTYGWDWCTRLIPLGIWRGVKLVQTGPVWLDNVWVRPNVDLAAGVDKAVAEVEVRARTKSATSGAEALVEVRIMVDERTVATATASAAAGQAGGEAVVTLSIPEPRLWWPNDMGEQPLYRVEVTAMTGGVNSDTAVVTTGLRSVRMVPNVGASAEALPYTFEVNGRRLFLRGWNWVPLDHMYGRDQGEVPPAQHPVEDRYGRILKMAAHAHCNLLRVWGGGFLEAEKFYDLCDRYGILVWQEFAHSSSGINNHPPADEEYLDYIEDQARQIVPLRRNHPSLVVWCGGNELMDESFVPLTSEYPSLARLRRVVAELDPDRGWLPTSPSGPEWHSSVERAGSGLMHDVHGPWKYSGAEKHYAFYNSIDPLLHSEFGVEGAANIETLKRFISEKYLWPPDPSNPAWVHHGNWWINREQVEALFGPMENIEDFVRASQWIQVDGLRYCIEAHRRRTGRCSGVLPWQLNEAYPNTSCTNAIDYLLQPKPVYWAVRQAYAPVSISLKYDRLTWEPGEEWHGEVWAVTSRTGEEGCRWRMTLMDLTGAVLKVEEGRTDLASDVPMRLSTSAYALSEAAGVLFVFLELEDGGGGILAQNDYIFSTATPAMRSLLSAPQVGLRVREENGSIVVENGGAVPALHVSVGTTSGTLPENGYFSLPPHGRRVIFRAAPEKPYRVRAWNAEEIVSESAGK